MKAPLALAFALALLGAGCFGARDETPVTPQETPVVASTPSDVPPDGRDGRIAAFNETNRTEAGSGGLDHAHDYWQGRERVTLLDEPRALCCPGSTPGPFVRILLPESQFVYEGTGQVEVTLSDPQRRACTNVYDPQRICSDRAAPGVPDAGAGVKLSYLDAASKEWKDAGPVAWGTPVVIQIKDPKQTDMPHAQSSLWAFRVAAPDASYDGLRFRTKIDAVRATGDEIPKWPGHPDFYAESPSRIVLQTSAVTRENGPMTFVDPAGNERAYVAPEKLVSYGTRTLHVFVNITEFKAENPALQPTYWALAWYNASTKARAHTDDNHTGTTKEHHWTLPVDDNGMDSPYADGSRWGFLLYGSFEAGVRGPVGPYVPILGCSGLCATYEVKYDITVIATNESLSPELYAVEPGT